MPRSLAGPRVEPGAAHAPGGGGARRARGSGAGAGVRRRVRRGRVAPQWIATSLDAPIGAFAPSIALFIVIAAVGAGGWVAPTALYALVERFERELTQPLRQLFERGQAAGDDACADIASARLTESLIGLIVGVVRSTPLLGKEDMIATITGLFLDGARARGPRSL